MHERARSRYVSRGSLLRKVHTSLENIRYPFNQLDAFDCIFEKVFPYFSAPPSHFPGAAQNRKDGRILAPLLWLAVALLTRRWVAVFCLPHLRLSFFPAKTKCKLVFPKSER